MNIKSEQLESVSCVIGQKTKKPNTVTMAVDSSFIIEVVTLFETLKHGKKPKTGLTGIKLVAEYAEDVEDQEKQLELIEGMNDGLKDAGITVGGLQESEFYKPHIDIKTGDVDGVDESLQDEFSEGEK